MTRGMKNVVRRGPSLGFAVFFAVGSLAFAQVSGAQRQGISASESSFLTENDAAMKKMMQGMAIKPSGNVDKDFVAMMVPHHDGAIDMARAVLRYGHNEKIRRIAQEIIVTQQQEIVAMRLAVGEPLPAFTVSAATSMPPIKQGAVKKRREVDMP